MDNLYVHIKKSAIISIAMIGVAIAVWLVTQSPIALGFAFGCSVGMLNTYILYRNISYISEVAVVLGEFSQPQDKQSQYKISRDEASQGKAFEYRELPDTAFRDKEFQDKARRVRKQKKKRRPILGLGTRIFFAIGALYIAQRFAALHLVATLLGIGFTLFLSYAFILLEIVFANKRERRES